MIDCLIMGDSIAVGVAQTKELNVCYMYAKGGINTHQFNKMYVDNHKNDFGSEVVVISLGSNDHQYVKTRAELEKMRNKIKAQRVYWILPAGNLKASNVNIQDIQNIVKQVASEHGDFVVPITKLQPDGIHPSSAGYKQIAAEVR